MEQASDTDMDRVIKEVRWMLGELEKPLAESELKGGWTEASRAAMQTMFRNIEAKLAQGEVPALNIPRGMDTWGITGGHLLQKGAEISVGLRNLRGSPSA